MTIVNKEHWTGKPMTKGYIFFGRKRPKNWRENLAAQQDPKLQEMIWEWCREKDPESKARKWKEAMDYWSIRRQELGFTNEEE